nr:hypothetical protein CFP56_65392 [Quercus suber]
MLEVAYYHPLNLPEGIGPKPTPLTWPPLFAKMTYPNASSGCQSKETEDGCGGCVVGGGGVGGRRQGRWSVKESEGGCPFLDRRTVGLAAGRTVVALQFERRGNRDKSEGE